MRASEFMKSVVTDDVLLEILVRLPDARTAIQSAAVCKRWRSLVLNPDFVRFFRKQHSATTNRNKKAVAFFNYSYRNELSFHQLSLSQSEYCYSECQPCDLSFFPPPPPELLAERRPIYLLPKHPQACDLVLRAVCDDLMLLSRNDRHYLICNWLTKEWVPLPEVPPVGNNVVYSLAESTLGFAVIRRGCGFKVVIVDFSAFFMGFYWFQAAVFDTESGRWSYIASRVPFEMEESNLGTSIRLETAVTGDGVLHFLDGKIHFIRLMAYNIFTKELRLIPLPTDGRFGEISMIGHKDKVRLGVVRGRLWLSQMTKTDDDDDCNLFGLKIWELDGNNDSWRLVRDVTLKSKKNSKKKSKKKSGGVLLVLAFDPNDDNAIFLMSNKEILRYEFDRAEYDRVCEFPCLNGCYSVAAIQESVAKYLNVLTLAHPCWPTSISPFKNHH